MKKAKSVNSHNNKKTNAMISTDNEMSKLILLILIVAIIFGIFYVITLLVTKKDKNESDSLQEQNYEAVIQYEKILATNILSKSNKEYYVLVYFNDDMYLNTYKNYLSYYATLSDSVPYYYVDADEVFNKEFVSDKSNLNVNKSSDFKFSQTTLLRIRDGKVISTYEGTDNITGKLGRMTK